MHVENHFFLGVVFALILFFIFPQVGLIEFFLVIAASVFIDADHYFEYVYRKKAFSLKKAYKEGVRLSKKFNKLSRKQQEKTYIGAWVFHGIESLIILFVFGIFLHKYFFFIFVGAAFHLLLDLCNQEWEKIPLTKLSVIYNLNKMKSQKILDS